MSESYHFLGRKTLLLGNIRKDTCMFSIFIYWLKHQGSAMTHKHKPSSCWTWSYEMYSFYTQEWVEVGGGPGLPVLVSPHLPLDGNKTIRTTCSVLCMLTCMTSSFPPRCPMRKPGAIPLDRWEDWGSERLSGSSRLYNEYQDLTLPTSSSAVFVDDTSEHPILQRADKTQELGLGSLSFL